MHRELYLKIKFKCVCPAIRALFQLKCWFINMPDSSLRCNFIVYSRKTTFFDTFSMSYLFLSCTEMTTRTLYQYVNGGGSLKEAKKAVNPPKFYLDQLEETISERTEYTKLRN